MILGAQRFRFERLATWLEDRRGLAVCALCLLWMVPGLLGRDPWKPEEAYIFGVVHEMVANGHWWIPHLAGEPFLRHPPFYHWTAALAVEALPFLAEHEAARLVNVLYGGITLWFLALATGRLVAFDRRWFAPLMLIGCVGILQPAHLLVPDNAVLAAYALAVYGLAAGGPAPAAGALAFGTGLGLAFLARGVFSALPLALTLAALPILVPVLRQRDYGRFALVGILVAVPWLVIWPVGLYLRDPDLFRHWLWLEQIGRFWRQFPDAGAGNAVYYLKVLPWFSWPAWPFALWALWLGRGQLRTRPGLALPLILLLATFAVLSLGHDKREWFALPLLVPLCLLAIGGVPELRRGAINVFFWFGIAFFLFFLAVVWFYFSAVEFGVPERAARHMARMEPGYRPGVSVVLIIAAVVLTVAWILLLFNIRRSPERPFVTWAAGATAFWVALMFLMVGWVDNAKSYRTMIQSLSAALPSTAGCVASQSLGESQRALIQYLGGIVTRRVEAGHRAESCEFLLVEGSVRDSALPYPWVLHWEGHRAGDDRERYRLYRREGAGGGAASPPVESAR